MTPKIDARNGCYGNDDTPQRGSASSSSLVLARKLNSTPDAPKYDGNLLPAMTAMVTGFVDKVINERAKLFRDSTRSLLPEFAYLLKQDGDPNHAPHDCIEHLRYFTCEICGAHYERIGG